MKFYLAILLSIFSFGVFAQQENSREGAGRLQAYKIAFITNKLELSPKEAQQFWPLYNKYEDEMREARRQGLKDNKNEIEREEKLLSIRKKYQNLFTGAISTEKINLLYKSEKEFNALVQKELMERRERRRN